jgi:hypothetical protein
VTATAPEHVALLMVRAWHEGEDPAGLRARVTWVMDVDRGDELTVAAAGQEAILALIVRWLHAVAARPARQPEESA